MSSIRKRIWQAIEDGCASVQDMISYLLLPLALPIIFAQELIAYVQKKAGFGKRTLEGKVVLITGASSGIGESLARRFYLAGCHVILAARRKGELERVRDDLARLPTRGRVNIPVVLQLDVSDIPSIPDKCSEAFKIYGKIDILINNAGISCRGNVLTTKLDVHRKVMDVNYFGTLAMTQQILPYMTASKSGNIVFMSSIQGRIAIPDRAAYAASKHAVQALADSLRAEISSLGVQVTVISPGYVNTNLSVNALTHQGDKYGVMDENTAKGYSSDFVAERTYQAVVNGEKEVVLTPPFPKIAIFLRYLMPEAFFYLMKKRAGTTKT